jgi:hypothetical protein
MRSNRREENREGQSGKSFIEKGRNDRDRKTGNSDKNRREIVEMSENEMNKSIQKAFKNYISFEEREQEPEEPEEEEEKPKKKEEFDFSVFKKL